MKHTKTPLPLPNTLQAILETLAFALWRQGGNEESTNGALRAASHFHEMR